MQHLSSLLLDTVRRRLRVRGLLRVVTGSLLVGSTVACVCLFCGVATAYPTLPVILGGLSGAGYVYRFRRRLQVTREETGMRLDQRFGLAGRMTTAAFVAFGSGSRFSESFWLDADAAARRIDLRRATGPLFPSTASYLPLPLIALFLYAWSAGAASSASETMARGGGMVPTHASGVAPDDTLAARRLDALLEKKTKQKVTPEEVAEAKRLYRLLRRSPLFAREPSSQGSDSAGAKQGTGEGRDESGVSVGKTALVLTPIETIVLKAERSLFSVPFVSEVQEAESVGGALTIAAVPLEWESGVRRYMEALSQTNEIP